MIKKALFLSVVLLCLCSILVYSQSEKVEVSNQVYDFLDRLYIRGIIKKYSSMSYPLSRGQITKIIEQLNSVREKLNDTERKTLDYLLIEFEYDLYKTENNKAELFEDRNFLTNLSYLFSDKERFIYSYQDSMNTFFANAIIEFKSIIDDGDDYKGSATLAQWGFKARGTVWKNLGYGFLATNGQVIGNKDIALKENYLINNYKIHESDAKNFDFTEGYITYDNENYAFQVGRERMIFGNGYDELLAVSPVNAMDFIKFETSVGIFNYTFIHNWLLSKEQFDHSDIFTDKRIIASKYLALHRFGLSLFDNDLDLGFSEMIIYSNRPVEIAYLTPLIFYKSVEHSLQDRDNAIIQFDASARLFNKLKLYGTFVIDELDFAKLNTNWWGNLFAYQVGGYLLEPIPLENLDVYVEYTKILPYTFTHRIADNSYTNYNSFIGANMHPNSDKIRFCVRYGLSKDFKFEIGSVYKRHGKNVYDEADEVIRNVGGDINLGHRLNDSEMVKFLDGDVEKTLSFDVHMSYRIFNNIFLRLNYSYCKNKSLEESKQQEFNFMLNINY